MNKRFFLLLLSITLLFLVSFSYPEEKGLATDKVTYSDSYLVETVNPETPLYSGAGDNYKVETIIPEGVKVVVNDEFVASNKEHWFHVQYNHSNGWIRETGLKQLEIKDQYFTSSSAAADIRRGAQPAYQKIGTIQNGQIVKAITGFTDNKGEKWVQIANGKTKGWSLLSSMELFDGGKNYFNKPVFIQQDAQVRNGASNSAKAVYTLKKGQQVTIQSSIILSDETWYRIKDGARSGWIHASDASNQLILSTFLYVIDQSADVRNGANSSYKAVSTLTIGQKVKTTNQFIGQDGQMWYKVVLGNGKSGWILGKSLSTKPLKIAYLTIDDGPSIYTGKLLDTLTKYHVKATFFMINGNMNVHQNEVKRMVKEGHAVGSHSVTHDKNKFYRSPSSAVNEMMTTRNTIKKITGVTSNLMRTPYGSVPYMKQSYRAATNKQHFIMWDWTVDSLDWKFNSSAYVNYTLNQVKRQGQNGTVPVILMHDRKASVASLPALLAALEKMGYTLVPLNESIKPYQFHTSK